MVSNELPDAQANTGQMFLMAATPRDLYAMTTTIIRGKNLIPDGYSVVEGDRHGFYTVTGQPTVAKRTQKVTSHGPYEVDVLGGTCTCVGFERMKGVCKHLECATARFAGVVSAGFGEVLEKQFFVLSAPDGQRLVVHHQLVYAFRSRDLAQYQASAASRRLGPLEVRALTLDQCTAMIANPNYTGTRLMMQGDWADIAFPQAAKVSEPNFATASNDNAWATWREDVAAQVPELVGVGHDRPETIREHRFPDASSFKEQYAAMSPAERELQIGKDF